MTAATRLSCVDNRIGVAAWSLASWFWTFSITDDGQLVDLTGGTTSYDKSGDNDGIRFSGTTNYNQMTPAEVPVTGGVGVGIAVVGIAVATGSAAWLARRRRAA